jgi:hypothetical protein
VLGGVVKELQTGGKLRREKWNVEWRVFDKIEG